MLPASVIALAKLIFIKEWYYLLKYEHTSGLWTDQHNY